MTEGNRLADFFAFLLAVLTNRGIRTVGLTNSPIFFPQLYFSRPIDLASKPETTGLEKQSTHSAPERFTTAGTNKQRRNENRISIVFGTYRFNSTRLDSAVFH
ncbi:hypothetical protein B296_00000172 [Ensete ventricosum]|uniref:Uncharacterized protein n=1 Tax=Ensete ventricosum TaxID=4639 RepID=A0A426Z419_ENSVE|nr:hypothetical protein B296_00000172 [Ensete ventricosum]